MTDPKTRREALEDVDVRSRLAEYWRSRQYERVPGSLAYESASVMAGVHDDAIARLRALIPTLPE